MNWIKCSDRLPDNPGKSVLAWDGQCFFSAYYKQSRGWECLSVNGEDAGIITHWAEVEPPKE